MMIYRALGALLHYPTAELAGAAKDICAVVQQEAQVSAATRRAISRLTEELAQGDLLTLQENYVGLFDRSLSLSLHLFEHIHGESRDRGQAMVNLAAHYEDHGYRIDGNELPDYLPLFLEFLSLVGPEAAADRLADVVHILGALRFRLKQRGSGYTHVFEALEELSAEAPDKEAVAALVEADRTPEAEAAELDSEWEEVPAFSGTADGSCSAARDILNRMAAPARPPAAGIKTEKNHV